jgi:hypothetical protein
MIILKGLALKPTSKEIADVTIPAVCRALQNSQNTNPENMHA